MIGGYEPNPHPLGGRRTAGGFQLCPAGCGLGSFRADDGPGPAPGCRPCERSASSNWSTVPESFTPDGNFILGEAPELRGFFVGAGFNAFGIASGGGAGRALAEWIVADEPPYDLWAVDIRRFGAVHRDRKWVAGENAGNSTGSTTPSPGRPRSMAVPGVPGARRCMPRCSEGEPCFGEKMGLGEGPNWFASPGVEPEDRYSFERPNWFDPRGRGTTAVYVNAWR